MIGSTSSTSTGARQVDKSVPVPQRFTQQLLRNIVMMGSIADPTYLGNVRNRKWGNPSKARSSANHDRV
eukprot:4459192-Lingulodinium_polyedra.AAC.1